MAFTVEIETKRLIIKPLSEEELSRYILDDYSLESSLSLEHRPRIVPDVIRTIITTEMIPNLRDKNKDNLYYTFWGIVSKELNVLVADLCFKGAPNKKGEVEIGYGTYQDFQSKGYMTEAIGGLVNWAFDEKKLTAILAETDPKNIPSIRILEKNGFNIERQSIDNIYWRRERS